MGTVSHKDEARSILANLIGAKSHQELQFQKALKWAIISSTAGSHPSKEASEQLSGRRLSRNSINNIV